MNTRTKIGVCLVLMVMGIAPLASAHMSTNANANQINVVLDSTPRSSEGNNAAGCRWYNTVSGNCPSGDDGVSGNYYNAAQNFFLASDATPLQVLVGGIGATIFPFGEINAFGSNLCDMEVGGDGTDGTGPTALSVLDEPNVDSDKPTEGGGMVPEGTWDDGGDSAACHVGSYDDADFNTHGCPGYSHAEDLASGADVWIAATCDDSHTVNNGGAGVGCALNVLIQNRSANALLLCLDEVIADELTPTSAPPTVVCGFDGAANGVNFGRGGGDLGAGVPYPALTTGCTASDALAATFVMSHVEVNVAHGFHLDALTGCYVSTLTDPCVTDPSQHGCDLNLLQVCAPIANVDPGVVLDPYTNGWIDWTATGTAAAWSASNGTQVHVLPTDFTCKEGDPVDVVLDALNGVLTTEVNGCDNITPLVLLTGTLGTVRGDAFACSNGFDDDGDGFVDADDSQCHSDGNAGNPQSYNPCWDDETTQAQAFPAGCP